MNASGAGLAGHYRVRVPNLADAAGEQVRVEYEAENGLEVLVAQVQCLAPALLAQELQLVDYAGRDLTSDQDIADAAVEGEVCAWALVLSAHTQTCSALIASEPVLQPAHALVDTDMLLCASCAQRLSPELVASEFRVLRCFRCDSPRLEDMGLLSASAAAPSLSEPVRLHWLRLLMDTAVAAQASSVPHTSATLALEHAFARRVESTMRMMDVYEDPSQQLAARNRIGYAAIRAYALEHLETEPTCPEDQAFLRGLLRWFKSDFFAWCNQPACANASCNGDAAQMDSRGQRPPNATEQQQGWAGRTEVYQCRACAAITDFPRYNNPSLLLDTRVGRCGEWANAFCLVCRALSLDARYVLDFTDHVWVEVWVPSLRRWTHLDACEAALDSPLLYEAGWGKRLTYVLSFSRYGIVDASPRYTRRLGEAMVRRAAENPSEDFVQREVARKDAEAELRFLRRRAATPLDAALPMKLDSLAQGKALYDRLFQSELSAEEMRERKRALRVELLGMRCLGAADVKLEELRGRLSGARAWRLARGELGEELN